MKKEMCRVKILQVMVDNRAKNKPIAVKDWVDYGLIQGTNKVRITSDKSLQNSGLTPGRKLQPQSRNKQ